MLITSITIILTYLSAYTKTCTPTQSHITLGPHFSDPSSPIIFTIGFIIKDSCSTPPYALLKSINEHIIINPLPPTIYTYKNSKISYHSKAYFIQVTNIQPNTDYTWQIIGESCDSSDPFIRYNTCSTNKIKSKNILGPYSLNQKSKN